MSSEPVVLVTLKPSLIVRVPPVMATMPSSTDQLPVSMPEPVAMDNVLNEAGCRLIYAAVIKVTTAIDQGIAVYIYYVLIIKSLTAAIDRKCCTGIGIEEAGAGEGTG